MNEAASRSLKFVQGVGCKYAVFRLKTSHVHFAFAGIIGQRATCRTARMVTASQLNKAVAESEGRSNLPGPAITIPWNTPQERPNVSLQETRNQGGGKLQHG